MELQLYSILSVKKGNEIFSIGDLVKANHEDHPKNWEGKITEFWITGSGEIHICYNGHHFPINDMVKVEPIPTGKEVSAEEVLDILTNTPAINFDCDNYPKCECDGYCTNISAMAKKIASQFKAQPIEDKTFPYLKSEQDFQIIAMKALGINYPENGSTFEQCVNTVLMLAKNPKEEADKIQKAIEYVDEILNYLESIALTDFGVGRHTALKGIKQYLLSIK